MNDASVRPTLDEKELATLAVFPLPRVVLFPRARLPLHIFEPRYREMMADIVAADRQLLAVAQLRPGWQSDYGGEPEIYDVAGVGRIASCKHNDDGTFDIELLGLARVRLHELPMAGRNYRRARATPLYDRLPRDGVSSSELASLFSLATQVGKLVQSREPRFRLLAAPDDPAAIMVDKVAEQFVGNPDTRQHLLEMVEVAERIRHVASHVAHLQLTLLEGETDAGPPTLH